MPPRNLSVVPTRSNATAPTGARSSSAKDNSSASVSRPNSSQYSFRYWGVWKNVPAGSTVAMPDQSRRTKSRGSSEKTMSTMYGLRRPGSSRPYQDPPPPPPPPPPEKPPPEKPLPPEPDGVALITPLV